MSRALEMMSVAVNGVFSLDPNCQDRLARLDGKSMLLFLTDWNQKIVCHVEQARFNMAPDHGQSCDVQIQSTTLALTAKGERRTHALHDGDLVVTGDVQVAGAFLALIEGVNIDWEDHLSRVVGDMAAHQLGESARGVSRWGQSTVESLKNSVSEYVTEEIKLLPTRTELELFYQDVDVLRQDVDRLAAHFKQQKEED